MLSSSEIESYHQDGFFIPDFRIDEQTLEQIRSDHERLLKKHPEFLNYCPNVLAYDLSFFFELRADSRDPGSGRVGPGTGLCTLELEFFCQTCGKGPSYALASGR